MASRRPMTLFERGFSQGDRAKRILLPHERQSMEVVNGETWYLDERGWYADGKDGRRLSRVRTWRLRNVWELGSLRYRWWREQKVYWYREQWCLCVVYGAVHYLHPCE